MLYAACGACYTSCMAWLMAARPSSHRANVTALLEFVESSFPEPAR